MKKNDRTTKSPWQEFTKKEYTVRELIILGEQTDKIELADKFDKKENEKKDTNDE